MLSAWTLHQCPSRHSVTAHNRMPRRSVPPPPLPPLQHAPSTGMGCSRKEGMDERHDHPDWSPCNAIIIIVIIHTLHAALKIYRMKA